jgi:hypothetical protein
MKLKVTTTLPHGKETEEIELAPDSTIDFVRDDGARYPIVVNDALAESALIEKKR